VWTTKVSINVGSSGVAASLREWVNDGLMTFYFLVVGLEAKRELDMGELRERRRLALPVGGMTGAVAIYLAFSASGPGARGWAARGQPGRADDAHCGRAERVIRELLVSFGDDLRYVWRHLPLTDVHPHAEMAAEAAEAAGLGHADVLHQQPPPPRTL
jgi:Na+/H+ antiporter 1